MNNNRNVKRRQLAYLSVFGTTQIHPRNPYIIAAWSIAFPGYGHILLSKYLRGFSLIIWELFINQVTHLNLAMVYSFIGEIEAAKEVLNIRYLLLYIPVYLFAIWDSYRTTVDLNKIYYMNEKDAEPPNPTVITPLEINYLDKRKPLAAIFWSMTIPSMGHLYIHRIFGALFTLASTVIYIHFSNLLTGVHYLFIGDIEKSTSVLNIQWLLYIPSFYFFSIYDTYVNVVENNKLYETEQKRYLINHYQPKDFLIKKGIKV